MYDSREETQAHIQRVQYFLHDICDDLDRRAEVHDASKLEEPEKSAFDAFGDTTRNITYGTQEYLEAIQQLGPALTHHYEVNDHHPQHHKDVERPEELIAEIKVIRETILFLRTIENNRYVELLCEWLEAEVQALESPVTAMSFLSIGEMIADWRAASERYANGSFDQSLAVNKRRFVLGSQLYWILKNTQKELGW